MAKNLVKPSFQTREYDANDVVAVQDIWQLVLYMRNGAKPVDLYISNESGRLVALFLKSETRELYEKYRRFELK